MRLPKSERRLRRMCMKQRALEALQRSGAQVLCGRSVFHAEVSGLVQTLEETSSGSHVEEFRFEQLILATGARERFLPFLQAGRCPESSEQAGCRRWFVPDIPLPASA